MDKMKNIMGKLFIFVGIVSAVSLTILPLWEFNTSLMAREAITYFPIVIGILIILIGRKTLKEYYISETEQEKPYFSNFRKVMIVIGGTIVISVFLFILYALLFGSIDDTGQLLWYDAMLIIMLFGAIISLVEYKKIT